MNKVILSILLVSLKVNASGMDLIYGTDNRYETDEYSNQMFREKAKSVAIRVLNRKLSVDQNNSDIINLLKIPMTAAIPNVCEDERFSSQNMLGDCSGFLIAKNKILTAGHCAFSEFECANTSWIFDYKNDVTQIDAKNVYKCKKIEAQSYKYEKRHVSDYAIIELDRDTDRAPLEFRKFGTPLLGTKLVLIGYPLGLPQKIADEASVKFYNDEDISNLWNAFSLHHDYFIANTDSYGGNSGSPIFNQRTGKVEGILVQGADDFQFNDEKGCSNSVRLSNSHHNSFEKVLRITRIPELK